MSRVEPFRSTSRPRGLRSRRRLAAFVATTAMVSACLPALATELPLTRVVLSSSGLAQFSHAGQVAAGSTIDLAVRLDQVDDVLKSLTVFDALGAVGPVSLPGREPLGELFRDLPFDLDALNSPTALVNALVGSEVEISGPVTARGRVFRVEPEQVEMPDGRGIVTRHRLSLLTEKGLVQAVFEDITSLAFTDPQARAQIDRALAGIADNRAKDRRRLAIEVLGQGKRDVAVGYVVGAPIWKTSWRLVLPKAAGKARLQGWAVLENLTGGDWKDIELTLVSGNPVALTQPLYTAVYGDRTEVPIAGTSGPTPRADFEPVRDRAAGGLAKAAAERAAPAPKAFAAMVAPAAPPPMAPPAEAMTAEAQEAATQLIYRFPGKVSLLIGHTMMLPFVDREIAAERVWLFQPETDNRHPLATLRLTNDGETALPPGIVTTFETSAAGGAEYVGDAVLPLVARGATKLVSFALDQKTDVRREDRGVRRTTLGTAVDGRLTMTVRSRHAVVYEITPPPDEDRDIVVEEIRAEGWAPAAGIDRIEATPTRFRWPIAAPKGKTTRAELVLERTDSQSVLLTTLPAEEMLARVKGLDNEGPAFKEAIDRLSEVVADITRAETARKRAATERDGIVADQNRIRANLTSVGNTSDLGRRYLDTLKTQENRLAEIARTDAEASDTVAQRRKAAEDIVRRLKL